jgi:hypothetical protein
MTNDRFSKLSPPSYFLSGIKQLIRLSKGYKKKNEKGGNK